MCWGPACKPTDFVDAAILSKLIIKMELAQEGDICCEQTCSYDLRANSNK